ncbi:DUF3857 domain-containing protein [Flagellimonas sp. S174]|uniref:DUF3857 domain-containing protein n=1 Tax=Flagellimonas sp. S174 TaxID=3410790 RepID=UPI003BF58793
MPNFCPPRYVISFFLFLLLLAKGYGGTIETSESLYKGVNAIVRLDEMKINVLSVDKMTYTVKIVTTVLNEYGDSYARSSVSFDKEKQVKGIYVKIYDNDGGEIEHIKRKEFQNVSATDGFSLYRDDRVLTYRYVPISYPYTMEFYYEVETSDTGFFPQWYFLSGYAVSVEKSIYSITYASQELKPIIKERNLKGFNINSLEDSNNITYTGKSIAALYREELSPNFNKIVPRLSVRLPKYAFKGINAEINTWQDLGSWMNKNLLDGRQELPMETKQEVIELVDGIEDKLEKAKKVYEYVQNNTRYISVQVGIGGFQPISAIEVDNVKYGDCKGLSNYTRALLKQVGVESFYVHVEAGRERIDFDEDFPDLLQGNHAILVIPYNNEYYWIDCTSQLLPFGFIGGFTDGRKVFVAKPDGGEIVETKSYLDDDNLKDIRGKMKMNRDGNLFGEIELTTKGIMYNRHFHYLNNISKQDVSKYYRTYWSSLNGLDILDYKFLNDKENVAFTEKVELSLKNYGVSSGNLLLVPLNVFNNRLEVPNRYSDRKYPVKISRGYLDKDEYKIELPPNFRIEAIPDKKKIVSDFGEYSMSVEKLDESNTILFKRSLLIKSGLYPKEKYIEYRAFIKAVINADNSKMVLNNKT